MTWLDDHCRLALRVTAWNRVTGPIVLARVPRRRRLWRPGLDADRQRDGVQHPLARRPGGRNSFEHELRRLGVKQKNGKPDHPQAQGKAERFQQTLKNWPAAQAPPPATLAALQALLDAFTSYYNTRRPHKSLPGRDIPAAACAARPKAAPGDRSADTHDQVRTDKIGATGTVTLRHGGRLYHIGTGRACAGTEILLLVQDLHVRIVAATTGELLRGLTLDPNMNHQPTGRPPGPKPRTP